MSVRSPNVAAMGAPGAKQSSFPDLNKAAEILLRETTFVIHTVIRTDGCLNTEFAVGWTGRVLLSVRAHAVSP